MDIMFWFVATAVGVVIASAIILAFTIWRAPLIENVEPDCSKSMLEQRADLIIARAQYHRSKFAECHRNADFHWNSLEAYAEDLCELHGVEPHEGEWAELRSVVLDGLDYGQALENMLGHVKQRTCTRMDTDDMLHTKGEDEGTNWMEFPQPPEQD